ncbi:MAG TPA: response regulator transcription factor [Thermoanaerobaculia bacterium]|nr:response regulator transcription factor [Thermoanaerobaculia bacterium]
MTSPGNIRIAIVEDDLAAQDALRLLIDGTPGFRCMGAFGSAEQALRTLDQPPAEGPPDVLLLDINLPGMPGSEAVRLFHDRHPAMAILMLTLYDDEERIFQSLCNGANGYLLKKTPPAKLLDAIREARDKGAPLSPEIANKVVRLFREFRPAARLDVDLTRLEVRLLSLLAEGYSYQSAADEMKVSINTIRNYIRSIYDKLHVHSKSEAVTKALKAGLI